MCCKSMGTPESHSHILDWRDLQAHAYVDVHQRCYHMSRQGVAPTLQENCIGGEPCRQQMGKVSRVDLSRPDTTARLLAGWPCA